MGISQYDFKGLKTGTSDEGSNFVGYATLKNQPVISVVLCDIPNNNFNDSEKMLEQANHNGYSTAKA